jgi:outer membrane protein assembly factor BamB
MRTFIKAVIGAAAFLLLLSWVTPAEEIPGSNLNWPMFRGVDATGVSLAKPLPVSWNLQGLSNIRWIFHDPGLGLSSPVVWENRIFITTAVSSSTPDHVGKLTDEVDMRSAVDKSAQQWVVYCLDRNTGNVLWNKVLYSGLPRSKRHPLNSFATPTPAVDGKHLLVMFGSEGLYCLSLSGELFWKKDFGALDLGSYETRDYQWGYASSPILYDGLAIVQCDTDRNGFLVALDVQSGREVWKVHRAELPSWSTPAVQANWGPPQLVVVAPFNVTAYNVLNGERVWKLYWGMEITESTPVISPDTIFISSGKGEKAPIYAVSRKATGDITLANGETSNSGVRWSKVKGGAMTTTPILYGDYLYSITDLGVLRCYVAASGELVYQKRVPGAFQASPVAGDGKLYLASMDGDVFVIKAGPDFELLATNAMNDTTQATPAITGTMLLVRTRQTLYSIALPGAS